MRSILALALGLTAATCGSGRDPLQPQIQRVNRDFRLRVGERAIIQDAGFSVRFIEVTEDSRCPSNALILCVWEGDGAVKIELAPQRGDALPATLHTRLEPKALELGAWRLELRQLDPYPATTDPIPPEEYIATFIVRPS